MVRALLRLVLIVVVVVGVGAFLIGYRWGDTGPVSADRPVVGTSGERIEVATERARQAGAKVGEKIALGAHRAQEAVTEAGLTAKIKAKLALDDQVDAVRIDVDTVDNQVTLSGTVRSQTERNRALTLARETDGVGHVVDHLRTEQR